MAQVYRHIHVDRDGVIRSRCDGELVGKLHQRDDGGWQINCLNIALGHRVKWARDEALMNLEMHYIVEQKGK